MQQRYPFINFVNLLLRIIWYFQWVFGLILILSAISVRFDISWLPFDKLNGFQICFSEIGLGNLLVNNDQLHEVTMTHGCARVFIEGFEHKITALKILAAILELIVWMYIVFSLRNIFSNLKKGEFFVRKNGILLKRIAISIIGISLFTSIYKYILSSYIFNHISIEGMVLKRSIEPELLTLFTGLILAVLAFIFIRGAEIKEEQDLTI